MYLPAASDPGFRLAAGWRYPGSGRPLLPPVSPAARGRGGRGAGVKQRFAVGPLPVRTWWPIQRLRWPEAWALRWLSPRGEAGYEWLRSALVDPPWRLRKKVAHPFDWIATMPRQLLHPRPKIKNAPHNTG